MYPGWNSNSVEALDLDLDQIQEALIIKIFLFHVLKSWLFFYLGGFEFLLEHRFFLF
jgi:hypothetical protein